VPDPTKRQIHSLFALGTVAGMTDGQLVDLFVASRGERAEQAFVALIERHGPAVFRACRAVLRDPHDAEDAFQATFLVLARKAGSLSRPGSLAGWLYGVALRVATRSRTARQRRHRHEERCAGLAPRTTDRPAVRDDVSAILHEELGRLPQRYREAVILCDLQEKSYAEAAQDLGCAPGTVGSRLARGRERLRVRLARRGFAPAMVSAALAVEARVGKAGPPSSLTGTTSGAAIRFAAEHAAGAVGAVPAAAVALAEGVLKTMFITKVKAVAAIGLLVVGTSVLAQTGGGGGGYQAAPGSDRLTEMERKMDRMLRLLEASQGPREPATEAPRPETPAPTTAEAATEAPKPETPAPAPSSDRLSIIERRLDRLEQRISSLEQARGGATSGARGGNGQAGMIYGQMAPGMYGGMEKGVDKRKQNLDRAKDAMPK
jgi:RNA polymerase sigma factor (sigma-70 family)